MGLWPIFLGSCSGASLSPPDARDANTANCHRWQKLFTRSVWCGRSHGGRCHPEEREVSQQARWEDRSSEVWVRSPELTDTTVVPLSVSGLDFQQTFGKSVLISKPW